MLRHKSPLRWPCLTIYRTHALASGAVPHCATRQSATGMSAYYVLGQHWITQSTCFRQEGWEPDIFPFQKIFCITKYKKFCNTEEGKQSKSAYTTGFQDLLQNCSLVTRQYGNGWKKKEKKNWSMVQNRGLRCRSTQIESTDFWKRSKINEFHSMEKEQSFQ